MVANVLVGLVAFLHVYFLVLEMFLWQTPRAKKIFRLSEEEQRITATLAANQGLYNGFLAAGLVWAQFIALQSSTVHFFLGCVIVAGVYGAMKVNKRIFFVQSVPAILGMTALCLGL